MEHPNVALNALASSLRAKASEADTSHPVKGHEIATDTARNVPEDTVLESKTRATHRIVTGTLKPKNAFCQRIHVQRPERRRKTDQQGTETHYRVDIPYREVTHFKN